MSGIEAGRVCVKTKGREAGEKAVVIELNKEKGFALIAGPKVKKRLCNLRHLWPTEKKIQVGTNVTGKELEKLLK